MGSTKNCDVYYSEVDSEPSFQPYLTGIKSCLRSALSLSLTPTLFLARTSITEFPSADNSAKETAW